MRVDQFDFALPENLIALRPVSPRDSARMMVVGADGAIQHAQISDLPRFLKSTDALVLNDSKVVSARLRGTRAARDEGRKSAKIEILLHKRLSAHRFSALARPARKLMPGDSLTFGELQAIVFACGIAGEIEIDFVLGGQTLDAAIAIQGEIPLPPYIAGRRKVDTHDSGDYQTLYAREPGSVAAPTAGLHFTESLLDTIAVRGVHVECLTLHIGLGTFLPVTASDTTLHRMHSERAILTAEAAGRLNQTRVEGGRIAAVGTTSLRTLESATDAEGRLHAFAGETDIFITPGYHFKTAEILLTNFHLPRSTLFMLVCAFSGLEAIRVAYAEAILERYRFYSYGDACLLFRPSV